MFIADLHIHSSYSRATSRECVPEYLDLWARRKGIDLLGTGDFTHPAWRDELREKFTPAEEGLYRLKDEYRIADEIGGFVSDPRFVLSAEISSIYKQDGRVRKVHNIILLPSLEAAERLSKRLELIGNLHSDGRPILGLPSHDLLEITLDVCPDAIFIPAHIWTPHFSLFGAYSGFDSIEECFGDLTGYIYALETGLSSDPPMNARLSALDRFTMVSNSDAHSPANLAREANLFDTTLSFPAVLAALMNRDSNEFYGTLEFFPEEGKYHNDGHRACKVCLTPEQTIAAGGKCPVCGRRITVGVYHRLVELADRPEGFVHPNAKHFESLVPLMEVIAASMGVTTASKKVKAQYLALLKALGPELFILRESPLEEIERQAGPCVAEGVRRLRAGEVEIHPGYDGEYGKILVMNRDELSRFKGQLSLLSGSEDLSAKQNAASAGDEAPGGEVAAEAHARSGHRYGLNDEQWAAASAREKTVAVLAGPGTGKTHTLVSRIAYLIEEGLAKPEEITALTFTNKAAAEMRTRLNEYFGSKQIAKSMHIGTFHSICLTLIGNKTVLSEAEALGVLSEVLRACNYDMRPREALGEISRLKNGAKGNVPQVVLDAYRAKLAALDVVDFDDILLETLALFRADDPKSKALYPRFSHLLVDEFQDCNPVQLDLIRVFMAKGGNLFVIGDPDQSIYGFRGADARCFAQLRESFAPVSEIRLRQNYRSTPEIVDVALHVIRHSEPVLEARRKSGSPVRLLSADSSFAEALFIAKEIDRMVGGVDMLGAHARHKKERERHYGLSDIAVLYRTHRQGRVIEDCLIQEGIPYAVAGKDGYLSERSVMGALAFFRFLLNAADRVSLATWLKAMSVPPVSAEHILKQYAAGKQNMAALCLLLREAGETEQAGLAERFAPLVRKEPPATLIGMWPEPLERLQNMALFHERMADFLTALTLGTEGDVMRSGSKQYASDAVTLMTLHAAKGLEYPAVFLCGVKDGLIPFRKRDGQCDLDEERRLFYVGATRARDELVLLTGTEERSPFLDDLPTSVEQGPSLPRKKPEGKQIGFF